MQSTALATSLLVAALVPVGSNEAGAQEVRPNVLIVITDDQRDSGTMSIMPRTRALVKRGGVTFGNAYATTPQCCPARASIMTGRYAHNHGVGNNAQTEDLDHSTTLQRHLQRAGYRTGLFGKFLNGWALQDPPPYFDHYALFSGGYYNYVMSFDGRLRTPDGYSTNVVGSRASRQIRQWATSGNQPWLMFVTPWAPHMKSLSEPRFARAKVGVLKRNPAMAEKDCSDKPSLVTCDYSPRKRNYLRAAQLRTLLSVDSMVQELRETLIETGELDNTLVFFMSDNGYHWGEHGLMGKKSPYREGIDIPMFMSFPGRVEPLSKDDRFVANIDVAPTVYDATGVPPPDNLDGRSLLDPSWSRDRLLLEMEASKQWPTWASTLTPDYQYTEYYNAEGLLSFQEYYNLVDDPWQLVNLLADGDPLNDPDPLTQLELQMQLAEDRSCTGATCP